MFAYLINLYHRAQTNQALTAHERAALKAVQGVFIGFLATYGPQLVAVYMAHGTFHWTQSAITSIAVGLFLGLLKLWMAQSDSHLGDILDAYAKEKQAQGVAELTGGDPMVIPAVHIVVPTVKAVSSSTAIVPNKPGQTAKLAQTPDQSPPTVPQRQFLQPQPSIHAQDTAPQPVVESIHNMPTDKINVVETNHL